MYQLWLLDRRGIPVDIYDTAALSEEEINKAYKEAQLPSIAKKHKIREVFGTKRRSAIYFGKGVPALLVYQEDSAIEYPLDVFPHRARQGGSTDRFDVAISEYLEYLIGQKTDKPVLEYRNEPLTLREQRRYRRRVER